MAGYSTTPLTKKLGIKPDSTVAALNCPSELGAFRRIEDILGELPPGAVLCRPTDIVDASEHPVILLFAREISRLRPLLAMAVQAMQPTAALWIGWPKKASKVPTDVNDAVVRELGLAAGVVDVKVCAIDDVWSGLKFVVRVRDRPPRQQGHANT